MELLRYAIHKNKKKCFTHQNYIFKITSNKDKTGKFRRFIFNIYRQLTKEKEIENFRPNSLIQFIHNCATECGNSVDFLLLKLIRRIKRAARLTYRQPNGFRNFAVFSQWLISFPIRRIFDRYSFLVLKWVKERGRRILIWLAVI